MAASQQKKTAKSTNEMKKSEALARNKRRRNVWSIVLFAVGIMFTAFSIIGINSDDPNMWNYIHGFFCGIFGVTVFFVGPMLIYVAIMISLDKGKSTIKARILQIILFIFLLSAAIQIIFIGEIAPPEIEGFGGVISDVYNKGKFLSGGGICSLLIGFPLLFFFRTCRSYYRYYSYNFCHCHAYCQHKSYGFFKDSGKAFCKAWCIS